MSSISQSSVLDDYFSAMLTVTVPVPVPVPDVDPQSVQVSAPLFTVAEPDLEPLPVKAEQPQYQAPFAIPEPDSSGSLQELDQLLESVVDIELDDLDLSLIQVDLDTVEDAQAATDEAFALCTQQKNSLQSEGKVAEFTVEECEIYPTLAAENLVTSESALVPSLPDAELDTQLTPDAGDDRLEPAESWNNIELPEQFQALFFEVAGVTFAVPLTELGGIHQTESISSIFGKPDWFLGIMQNREQRLNVVDTAKWVMPEQNMGDIDYQYLVQLNDSDWGLGCEKLLGNETLNKDDIKWRKSPGNRPWLAGMVKSRMCVLLHVEEMTKLLAGGINIHGQ